MLFKGVEQIRRGQMLIVISLNFRFLQEDLKAAPTAFVGFPLMVKLHKCATTLTEVRQSRVVLIRRLPTWRCRL